MELQKMDNKLANTNINISIVKQLFHFNQLTSFPISDKNIEGWSKSIEELEPAITPDVIKWICDSMKMGTIPYDNKKGIQNVFIGFKEWIKHQQKTNPTKETTELYNKYKLRQMVY